MKTTWLLIYLLNSQNPHVVDNYKTKKECIKDKINLSVGWKDNPDLKCIKFIRSKKQ